MAERKNFSGDRSVAFDYLGAARQSLMILKNDMGFNKLLTGSRTLDLPEGVRVYVACVFGQDTIDINVPPGTAVEALVRRQVQEEGRTIDAVPIEPEYQSAFIKFDFTDNAFCNDRGILTMTRQSATPAPRVYIVGESREGNGRPTTDPGYQGIRPVYFSPQGFRKLGLRNGTFQNERGGGAYGLSPDGLTAVGSVEVWDPQNGGSAGNYTGKYVPRACVWRAPLTSTANVVYWSFRIGGPSGDTEFDRGDSNAWTTNNGGSDVRGGATGVASWFRWNGSNNSRKTSTTTQVFMQGTTSPDGRLSVYNNRYRIDGGAWVTWAADSRVWGTACTWFQDPTPSPITTSISF